MRDVGLVLDIYGNFNDSYILVNDNKFTDTKMYFGVV
jgi:rRNA processing protein Gar1